MPAVMLLSGGLDSTVNLAEALERDSVRLCLFFDYGQRARVPEWNSAQTVAGHYGLEIEKVDLPWFSRLLPEKMKAPGGIPAGYGSGGEPGQADALAEAWIPNRNGVFVNVGAAYAERYECGEVVAGFNSEEALRFPDNSTRFIEASNKALEHSTLARVKLVSHTGLMSKRQILKRGVELGAPLSKIYSCYSAGPLMCGQCMSCRLLRTALAEEKLSSLLAGRFDHGS